MSAKPSALRMPSPSVGFFAQGKASVSHGHTAQRNPERSRGTSNQFDQKSIYSWRKNRITSFFN
ncbi:hypothetical protein E2562_030147 [Oryza meyeriana var. granulata]|uniref:Uncharacterized protein n=1 Tax=Oryza meyeriana var. granulata TaxID=110450 RepID=A0A6G1BP64_9ORYZ|nr:hypothetical protein E2562_030147 [Oryza meyeriana var. granulata]